MVRSRQGNWDALDQLDDTPKPTEEIFLYALTEKPGWMHLCIRGKGKAAGVFYTTGRYRHVALQIPDATLRDTQAWRTWCQKNHEFFKLKEGCEASLAALEAKEVAHA